MLRTTVVIAMCLSALALLNSCCGERFPLGNVADDLPRLEDAIQRYGSPTEQKIVRREQLPNFDPSTEEALRQYAGQNVQLSVWRRRCVARGSETLIIVSRVQDGRVIAANASHHIW
jgi:hypothetical protein